MKNYDDNFIKQIESYGFKARVISIRHIKEIQLDIENTRKTYKEIDKHIGSYLDKFNYNLNNISFKSNSIIVIAVPHPIMRIYFNLNSKRKAVIMPPMYLMNSSVELEEHHKKIHRITSIIKNILSSDNLSAKKVNFPCKLIAARSGLGEYGKNNICYINNESSFYWIGVYISDMPCQNDFWQEARIMNICTSCNLCIKNCPTGALERTRFIVHAGNCITLQNENEKDFPEWLNPKWNNSIIGCIRCQVICPVNRKHINHIKNLTEFNEQETQMILSKTPLDKFPQTTYKKLELINFIEYYHLLSRNLGVLLNH